MSIKRTGNRPLFSCAFLSFVWHKGDENSDGNIRHTAIWKKRFACKFWVNVQLHNCSHFFSKVNGCFRLQVSPAATYFEKAKVGKAFWGTMPQTPVAEGKKNLLSLKAANSRARGRALLWWCSRENSGRIGAQLLTAQTVPLSSRLSKFF